MAPPTEFPNPDRHPTRRDGNVVEFRQALVPRFPSQEGGISRPPAPTREGVPE